jgi:threonine/homoserine/homoserine lactone efflux protein
MPEFSTFALFSLAALGLLIVPGPAVFYIVTRSIDQGRAAGLVSVLGVHCGSFVHIGAAVLGVSAALASSAVAFNAVRYVGAAYLVFLGVRRLLERDDVHPVGAEPSVGFKSIFLQGMIVNILNPKTALFFFAFLPQFADPERGPVSLQMALFGLVFVALGIVTDGVYAFAASGARELLRKSRRILNAQRYVGGGMYITLGVTAALTGTKTSDR